MRWSGALVLVIAFTTASWFAERKIAPINDHTSQAADAAEATQKRVVHVSADNPNIFLLKSVESRAMTRLESKVAGPTHAFLRLYRGSTLKRALEILSLVVTMISV